MRYVQPLRAWRVSVIALSVCAAQAFSAAMPAPPYVAEVTGNRVNLRAGGSINYRILKVANKGEKLIVRDLNNGWAKVVIPPGVYLFISKKYVRQDANGEGIVTGENVNIRPVPNLREPVVCQMQKNDRVQIMGTSGDYYKVVPPAEAFGWISGKYVRFFGKVEEVARTVTKKIETKAHVAALADKEAEQMAKPVDQRNFPALMAMYDKIINDNEADEKIKALVIQRKTDVETILKTQDVKAQNDLLAARLTEFTEIIKNLAKKVQIQERTITDLTTPPPVPPTYTAKGRIKTLDRLWNRPGTHQLVDLTGKVLFLLKSDSHNLDEFSGRLVGINGEAEKLRGWHSQLLHVDEIDMLESLAAR